MIENLTTVSQRSFVLDGKVRHEGNVTLAQIGGRSTPLAPFTVIGLNPATGKYAPWASDNGTGVLTNPVIYVGDPIASATIVAGDVTGLDVLVGSDFAFDASQLVLEKVGDTLDTVCGTAPNNSTLRRLLAARGMFAQGTTLTVVG